MRPSWAERIAPALSWDSRGTTVNDSTSTTIVLPNGRRFGLLFLQHLSGAYNVQPQAFAGVNNMVFNVPFTTQGSVYLTYCEYGRFVQQGWSCWQTTGANIFVVVVEMLLPADAWAKIHSECISDLRPPAEYPG